MSSNSTGPTASPAGFSSRLGVLAATLGSAVGLGNIWKFPYLVGANGGAGFLLLYILAVALVGLPVMIAELSLGRHTRADAVTAFQKLAPGRLWWLVGAMGIVAAVIIMGFYTEVAGWVLAYTFKALTGALTSSDPQANHRIFLDLVSNPLASLGWQWLVLLLVTVVIVSGVSKGIEAVTKRLMPLLFLLLIVIGIRSLMLGSAMEGLAFLFEPDWSSIGIGTVITALGLAFFKLSIGMGTMLTYGSYFRADQDIPATALRVMLADLSVSLLAGIAIFPAVFAFGFKPNMGTSLAFETLPAVFVQMPGGSIFMIVFFVLMAMASMGAMLSLFEVPVAYLVGNRKWSRRRASVLTALFLALFGAWPALSNSALQQVTVFGLNGFDLYDKLSSNVLMPVGGIALCVFVIYVWKQRAFSHELANGGTLGNHRISGLLSPILRWISPLLIGVVLLSGLFT